MNSIASSLRHFHSTNNALGAVRKPLTSKRGNKNFYKGSRTKRTGTFSQKGNFITQDFRLRQFQVPVLSDNLSPYVSPKTIPSSKIHTCLDYFEQEKPQEISDLVWERCRKRALDLVQRIGNFKNHKSLKSYE